MATKTGKIEKIDLLYIHPFSFPWYDTVIPIGAIGLMNSTQCKKVGVFQADLSDKMIKQAKVIAMDCHWYASLYPIKILIKRCKRVNPSAHIILGGVTATILGEVIIKEFDCDFIIQGCADKPFQLLVQALLKGEKWDNIPNIVIKNKKNKVSYFLNNKDYSSGNYSTLDWLKSPTKPRRAPLIISKSCGKWCGPCYSARKKATSYTLSPQAFKKSLVYASTYAESAGLNLWKFVPNETYAKRAFSGHYKLHLDCEFSYGLPNVLTLNYIVKSFESCVFSFPTFNRHYGKSTRLVNINYLREMLGFLKDKKR